MNSTPYKFTNWTIGDVGSMQNFPYPSDSENYIELENPYRVGDKDYMFPLSADDLKLLQSMTEKDIQNNNMDFINGNLANSNPSQEDNAGEKNIEQILSGKVKEFEDRLTNILLEKEKETRKRILEIREELEESHKRRLKNIVDAHENETLRRIAEAVKNKETGMQNHYNRLFERRSLINNDNVEDLKLRHMSNTSSAVKTYKFKLINTFEAKYKGQCRLCNKVFHPNEIICKLLKNESAVKYAHKSCSVEANLKEA